MDTNQITFTITPEKTMVHGLDNNGKLTLGMEITGSEADRQLLKLLEVIRAGCASYQYRLNLNELIKEGISKH